MSFIKGNSGYLKSPGGRGLTTAKLTASTGLVAGAVAIWRGDVGVVTSGANVTSWTDSVGSLALTPTGTPTVETSPGGTDAIGCLVDESLGRSGVGSLPVGAAPRTVIFVGKIVTDSGGWGGFTYGGAAAGQGFGVSVHGQNNTITLDTSNIYLEGPSVNDGNWFIGVATYNGTSAALYLGKTLIATQAMTLNTASTTINVFRSWDGVTNRKGICGAAYVYPFAFTQAQVDQMVDYLGPLWTFGTPETPEVTGLAFTATSDTQGEVAFNTDTQDGTGYIVLVPGSSPATPSDPQIRAGLDANGDPVPFTSVTGLNQPGNVVRPVAGLTGNTQYTPFMVWADEYNVSSGVVAGTPDTTDPSAPPPDPDNTVDTQVTAAGLLSLLQSWNSNWNGTVPAGKTTADDRVIGIPSSSSLSINFNTLVFPRTVTIRPVGTYTDYACSTQMSGVWTFSNCENIRLYRMDFRGSGSPGANGHMVKWDGCTAMKAEGCQFFGFPVDPAIGPTTWPYGIWIENTVAPLVDHNAFVYVKSGGFKLIRNVTGAVVTSNASYFGSDDDYNTGGKSSAGAGTTTKLLTSFTFKHNYGSRYRHRAPGIHCDFFQTNRGCGVTNSNVSYNVAMLGNLWNSSSGNASYQGVFMSQANENPADAGVGPYLVEHNWISTAASWGLTMPQGPHTRTARFNTVIQTDHPAVPASNPSNVGIMTLATANVSERNLVVGRDASNPPNTVGTEGTNGVRMLIGNYPNPNFSDYTNYMNVRPQGEFTDLYDVRPLAGQRTHPSYTPSDMRIGCFDMWNLLFTKDPRQLLSEYGWPHKRWMDDWDTQNRFDSSMTGSYTADGDNA